MYANCIMIWCECYCKVECRRLVLSRNTRHASLWFKGEKRESSSVTLEPQASKTISWREQYRSQPLFERRLHRYDPQHSSIGLWYDIIVAAAMKNTRKRHPHVHMRQWRLRNNVWGQKPLIFLNHSTKLPPTAHHPPTQAKGQPPTITLLLPGSPASIIIILFDATYKFAIMAPAVVSFGRRKLRFSLPHGIGIFRALGIDKETFTQYYFTKQ